MKEYTALIIREKQGTTEDIGVFEKDGKFKVLAITDSGEEGVELALKLKPDFVITGLVTGYLDGLEVLERLKSFAPSVKTVVLSVLSQEEIIRSAIERGALYYFVKPVSTEVLRNRLIEIAESAQKDGDAGEVASAFLPSKARRASVEERISKIFLSVGIPPHIKGYAYLREGVKMAVENPSVINNITKQLYPRIGERYNTSASKVERAIRHAIEVAWNRNRIDSINAVFGVRAYVGSEKPTNGEFIALVADKMILEGA